MRLCYDKRYSLHGSTCIQIFRSVPYVHWSLPFRMSLRIYRRMCLSISSGYLPISCLHYAAIVRGISEGSLMMCCYHFVFLYAVIFLVFSYSLYVSSLFGMGWDLCFFVLCCNGSFFDGNHQNVTK